MLPALAILLMAAPPPEPAAQVRTLFQQHCIRCHGSAKDARAGLNVLDRAQLVPRLVVPGKPDESLLLQLVECSAMPSGTAPKLTADERATLRAWIAAGAADFPAHSGEPFILAQILADVGQLKMVDRANVRYLSLNHLLDEPDAAKDVDKYRAGLTRALNLLSANKKPIVLQGIDPENTIFRIRLDDLGWEKKPFVADPKNAAKFIDPTQVNLFDLVLLEYPYATPPDKALVESYLKAANLLRPVPYVRGDWFAAIATQPPLYGELLSLEGPLKAQMPAPAADDPLLFVTKRFARQAATVPPVDGLTLAASAPAEGLLKVELAMLDAKGKVQTEFHPGDKITLSLKNMGAVKLQYELIAADVNGVRFVLRTNELEPGAEYTRPITIGDKPGKEQLTVFAAKDALPAAVPLKVEKEGALRFVHPSYKIEGGVVEMRFDPARVIKQTVTFETLKK